MHMGKQHTHARTPLAQISISGVHVLHKLRVQALRGCLSLRILNQAVGSLLSKMGTLVRVDSWALHSCWESEMRDRRSLPRMKIIGLELGLGSALFSVHV